MVICSVKNALLDYDTVKEILSEYKIHNADVQVRGDYTDEGRRRFATGLHAIKHSVSIV